MLSNEYNANDPLFLVSRNLDGDLNEEERARLAGMLAESPQLAAEAAGMAAVANAVARRREGVAQVDWPAHRDLIQAGIADEEDELQPVDRLLAAISRAKPVYDEEALIASVLGGIEPAAKRRTRWGVLARLGAPLAAAAAIVLAVTSTFEPAVVPTSIKPITIVQIGPQGESGAGGGESVSVVSFVRSTAVTPAADFVNSVGYMTVGAMPAAQTWEESPL